MHYEGHLLIVLHEPPQTDDHARHGRFFWRSPEGEWAATIPGKGIKSLHNHIEQYAVALRKLDDREGAADSADDYFQIQRELSPLRRAARLMHEALQDARERVLEDHEIIICRDEAGALERTADLLASDAHTGLEWAMARKAEEQAELTRRMATTSHRLNIMAAMFFPLLTIAAIFGMSLELGISRDAQPSLFWVLIVVGVVLGVVFQRMIAKGMSSTDRGGNKYQTRKR